jgi:glucuronoarabinoxylan endo-1,4-beta-xylanase
MRKNLAYRVSLPLCLLQMALWTPADAQTVTVDGIVSTLTTVVRSASVIFAESNNTANTFSALTDSSGHYQLTITLTSVAPTPALPAKFELEQNYPNPFSTSTAISYTLKGPSEIQVRIYDILGRVVRDIPAGAQPLGPHNVLWDGCNELGQRVATGIYFYSLQAGSESQARKMVFNPGGSSLAPLPRTSASMTASVSRQTHQLILGGTYTVRIENTANTLPLITAKQIDNVEIRGDTTIDFSVENQIPTPVAAVYPDSLQQYIRGFGGANILPWRPDMTTAQTQTAFGTGQGQLGFSILRLRIPYTENPSEFAAQVPTAKLAQSLGALVFASPWTPPPEMKSNNNIVGGVLNESSYAAYAAHLKAFADYMANNGAPLYAVSLQNEPDATVTYESCSWNATQFLNFTKNNAAAIGMRVMMPESQNFVHALSDSTLNDSSAAANVAVIGGHIYGGGLGPYPLAVSKGKEVWMTEHLELDTSWTAVLATGREIHDCMNAGMNAYVWWYIVRFYGPIGEDGNVTKRGYVMSQYARFIRPGFHKIKCSPTPQRNVYLTSYKDSSSSEVVVIALNTSTSPIPQAFAITNGSMMGFTPYTTSQSKNCAQGNDIAVTNGTFAVSLDPSSITTFVSK